MVVVSLVCIFISGFGVLRRKLILIDAYKKFRQWILSNLSLGERADVRDRDTRNDGIRATTNVG